MTSNLDEIITMTTILQMKIERLKKQEIARENHIRNLNDKIRLLERENKAPFDTNKEHEK